MVAVIDIYVYTSIYIYTVINVSHMNIYNIYT